METVQLPNLVIEMDSADNQIKQLVNVIKPEWDENKLEIKEMSGGYSCRTYRVGSQGKSDNVIIVRVRKLFEELNVIANRELEEKVIQGLAKAGIFVKVYAIFKNGYCYQFVEGKPLLNLTTPQENARIEDYPFQEIAAKLAEVHSMKLEDVDYSKATDIETFETLLKNDYPEDSKINKKKLEKEFEEIKTIEAKFQQKIVLCHGDTHVGNIIWDQEKGSVNFIDWEIVHIGRPASDVAYFLQILDMAEITETVAIPRVNPFKKEDIKKKFIRFYLKKWSELHQDTSVLSDDYFDQFYKQVTFYNLVLCLKFVIIFGVIMARSKKNVAEDFPGSGGPNGMALCFYKFYKENKERILSEVQ